MVTKTVTIEGSRAAARWGPAGGCLTTDTAGTSATGTPATASRPSATATGAPPASAPSCAAGRVRDRRTCRSRVTPFSGGFEIDYAEAPRQGRCAELIVWVAGEREPRRGRVFGAPAGACG